jgi:GTPase
VQEVEEKIRNIRITDDGLEKIAPEPDDGNKEYKLKLNNGTQHRIDQWVSQMRYRMDEGCGECIYVLGVTDTGGLMGMTEAEYTETMEIFDKIVQTNHYAMTLISEKNVEVSADEEPRKIYEFLVREVNDSKYVDLKIAIAGNVDSGKSSTLGALMTGTLDNGRGSARLNVFNFSHEVKSGRTSSVGHHILGFDEKGGIVTHTSEFGGKRSWPEIIGQSAKVITFFDLCGHEKYLKTTILGMTSQFPDLAIITVGANMNVTKMTKEHIFLCLSLKVPFIVLVTKIDICKNRQQVLKDTLQSVDEMIKKAPVRRVPFLIESKDDVISAVKNFHTAHVVPIIHTSNVTGQGLDLLTSFLNLVPVTPKVSESKSVEFHVETTWTVKGVGTVIGGQLVSGTISVGDRLLLGPSGTEYKEVKIRSVQCKRVPLESVNSGCYVTLGLQKTERKSVRRGHVLLSLDSSRVTGMKFKAKVSVLKSHSTTIKVGYEPVLHTCSVRQTAKILDITDKRNAKTGKTDNDKVLRTNDQAIVTFRFTNHPEYIKPGFRLLLAEGRVKIIGVIQEIL